jgi:hypothetical protein
MRPLLCLFIVLFSCTLASADDNRLGFGRIVLDGHVESVEFDFGSYGKTRLLSEEGGRNFTGTTFRIPLPAAGEAGALLTPTVVCSGGGEARYLGWDSEPAGLSSTLRARSRPPVLRALPRPSVLSLLLVVLTSFAIWSARRAPRAIWFQVAALLGGVSAGAFVVGASFLVKTDRTVASVVDFSGVVGQPASWAGVVTEGNLEMIHFEADTLSLETQPIGAKLLFTAHLEDFMAGTWKAEGPRASKMWVRRPWSGIQGDWLHPGTGTAQNLGDFQAAWLRNSASEIFALGPWRADEARPEAGLMTPPSWLLSGLPMGREFFLGLLEASETFVRATWTAP